MRESTVAERLLALVTPPDRAATITGDLLEESRTRNAFWFWFELIRATLSLSGRAIATEPLLMGTLTLASILLLVIGIPFTEAWFLDLIRSQFSQLIIAGWSLQLIYWSKWSVLFLWARVLYPLVIGSIVSKLCEGRECVLCGAVAMLTECLVLSVCVQRAGQGRLSFSFLLLNSLPAGVFLAAGISVRWRAIRKASRC